MPYRDDIVVGNLHASLKKFDAYLRLAILASLAFAAVAVGRARLDKVPSEFGSLAIELTEKTLLALSIGATFVFGLLAAGTLDHIYRALRDLGREPALVAAACGYPSLATMEHRPLRIFAILAAPIVIAAASLWAAWGALSAHWLGVGVVTLFATIPFVVIGVALDKALDYPNRYRTAADVPDEYWFEEGCYITELSNTADDPAVSIARARVAPGMTTRWHRLRDTTERYLMLEGRGRVEVGDEKAREVGPREVVRIPPMVRQRIINVGKGDLVFLAICTPRFRPENYEDVESAQSA
jgi:mannose-6-phosphate isomerase-like protein (cupin superfamily)